MQSLLAMYLHARIPNLQRAQQVNLRPHYETPSMSTLFYSSRRSFVSMKLFVLESIEYLPVQYLAEKVRLGRCDVSLCTYLAFLLAALVNLSWFNSLDRYLMYLVKNILFSKS